MLSASPLRPPGCDRQALLEEVARDYDGPLLVGEDLMTIDLARRQVALGAARLALGGAV